MTDGVGNASSAHRFGRRQAAAVSAAREQVADLVGSRPGGVGGGSIYPTVQNFPLGCREAGLGTALTTLLCMYEPQVAEMLDIPEGVATAAHIAVGYRSTPFPRKLDRLPLSEIVFDETWGNSTY